MTRDEIVKAVTDGMSLRDANLYGADLRGANLRGADLGGAYLGGADLNGADLRGAHLRDAILRCADLRCADLRGAYLGGADLGGADLRGAYLRGAYLHDAKNAVETIAACLDREPNVTPVKTGVFGVEMVTQRKLRTGDLTLPGHSTARLFVNPQSQEHKAWVYIGDGNSRIDYVKVGPEGLRALSGYFGALAEYIDSNNGNYTTDE